MVERHEAQAKNESEEAKDREAAQEQAAESQVDAGAEGQEEGTSVEEEASEEEAVSPKAEKAEQQKSESRPTSIEDLKPGMRLRGRVQNVVDFGAFIDVGVGRDGLAHISTLRRAGIEKSVKPGDVIDVQIRHVDLDRNRISLTIPGAGRSAKTPLGGLEVGAMVDGRVVRIVDFGAFVDIGAQTDGLLHISELPFGYVEHPSDVLDEGQQVEVRVLDVDTDRRRISLSMKTDQPRPRPQQTAQRGPQRQEEPEEEMPSAFALAWEKALEEQREKQD